MGVVELLSGYFLTTKSQTNYRRQASERFAPFADDRVVVLFRKMQDGEFNFDSVPAALLRLTAPPSLAWRRGHQVSVPQGVANASEWNDFAAALRKFSRVARFQEFFRSNAALYRDLANRVDPLVVPNVDALQDYVGSSLGRWQVIVSPLMHDGGFATRYDTGREPETYALIGPLAAVNGQPDFGDEPRLQRLIVHEFAHSLINPLAAADPSEVSQYAGRFNAIRKRMEKHGYGDWTTVVNEHVVRAVTARVVGLRHGEEAGRRAVAEEAAAGFCYVPALVERLRLYEHDRRKWPTLQSFYRELLRGFGEEAVVARGDMDAAQNPGPCRGQVRRPG